MQACGLLLSRDRPAYCTKAYPSGCQHRFTNPAETKALPCEGASALVIAWGCLWHDIRTHEGNAQQPDRCIYITAGVSQPGSARTTGDSVPGTGVQFGSGTPRSSSRVPATGNHSSAVMHVLAETFNVWQGKHPARQETHPQSAAV